MEGLAAFVSSFDDGKLEVCPLRPDTFSAADKSRKDYMPSTTSTSNLLPFSIDEILRDRQGIIDHGSQPQPSNIVHDVSGSKHDFPHFEGKTGVDFKNNDFL